MPLLFNNVSTSQQYWFRDFRPANYRSETYLQKATRIENIFNDPAGILAAVFGAGLGLTHVDVTLQTMMQSDVTSTLGVGYTRNAVAGHIVVMLSSWYFENYSLGYCAGLLCHELGAHSMANPLLGGVVLGNETINNMIPINYWVGLGGVGNVTMIPGNCGQQDHGYAAVPGSPRFDTYEDLVISVADTMRVGPLVAMAGNLIEVTCLFDCYLMDIASILTTNDHRGQGLGAPARLAAVYNALRVRLIGRLGVLGLGALVAFVPPVKNSVGIVGDYAQVLYALTSAVSWNWSTAWAAWRTPV